MCVIQLYNYIGVKLMDDMSIDTLVCYHNGCDNIYFNLIQMSYLYSDEVRFVIVLQHKELPRDGICVEKYQLSPAIAPSSCGVGEPIPPRVWQGWSSNCKYSSDTADWFVNYHIVACLAMALSSGILISIYVIITIILLRHP